MSQKPLISTLVRTVNRPRYLRECLASLFRQDYPRLQVVVVNDGGPSIEEITSQFQRENYEVTLIQLPHRSNMAVAANTGFLHCKGEYFSLLDDDDIYYPFHLSCLQQHSESTGSRIVYSDALRAEQVPNDSGHYMTKALSLQYSEDFDYQRLQQGNFIPNLCFLLRREVLPLPDPFDPEMEVLDDWDLWLRLGTKYQFSHLREITCEYRYRQDATNTIGQIPSVWQRCEARIREKLAGQKLAVNI